VVFKEDPSIPSGSINPPNWWDNKCPVPGRPEAGQVKLELMEKNGLPDCYIRAFSWRGSEMMGVVGPAGLDPHLCGGVGTGAITSPTRTKGIRVTMSDWKRPSPETIPSAAKAAGLYMICTMSKHKAEAAGFADALMLDYRGYVAELTGATYS